MMVTGPSNNVLLHMEAPGRPPLYTLHEDWRFLAPGSMRRARTTTEINRAMTMAREFERAADQNDQFTEGKGNGKNNGKGNAEGNNQAKGNGKGNLNGAVNVEDSISSGPCSTSSDA